MAKKKKDSISDLFGDSPAPPKPVGENNSGAAAELAAIESDARRCRQMRDAAFLVWEEADRKNVLGDDVKEADERRAWGRYLEMRELYENATKQLAVFDKGVAQERREGEKVPLVDVKEWFAQLRLCRNITLENYLIGISQLSPKFKTPVDFMKAHGDLIRSTEETAIAAAVKEKQLPDWIVTTS